MVFSYLITYYINVLLQVYSYIYDSLIVLGPTLPAATKLQGARISIFSRGFTLEKYALLTPVLFGTLSVIISECYLIRCQQFADSSSLKCLCVIVFFTGFASGK